MKNKVTIKIDDLIELINSFNKTSIDEQKDYRLARNELLEEILLKSKRYNGFNYLNSDQLSGDAMSVGVRERFDNGRWNFEDTDHSRVYYFK